MYALSHPLANDIVVVEDSPFIQKMMSKVFAYLHYEVEFVDNGLDAVTRALADPAPCLMFMDIRLPDITGYQAIERIRQLEKENALPPMPIIILSARPDDDLDPYQKVQGMVSGIYEKPINIGLLKALLKFYRNVAVH